MNCALYNHTTNPMHFWPIDVLGDFANQTERRSKSVHFKINYNWELDPSFVGGKKKILPTGAYLFFPPINWWIHQFWKSSKIGGSTNFFGCFSLVFGGFLVNFLWFWVGFWWGFGGFGWIFSKLVDPQKKTEKIGGKNWWIGGSTNFEIVEKRYARRTRALSSPSTCGWLSGTGEHESTKLMRKKYNYLKFDPNYCNFATTR